MGKAVGELNGVWAAGFKLLVMCAVPGLGLLAWILLELKDHGERQAVTEANQAEIVKALDAHGTRLSVAEAAIVRVGERILEIPNQIPQQWFRDRVDRLEDNQETMSATISANSQILATVSTKLENLEKALHSRAPPG